MEIPTEIRESLEYMSDVFLEDRSFRKIVDLGEMDEFSMEGDDLAGFCWHFDQVLQWAGINRSAIEREKERQARASHPSNGR